MRTPGPHSVPLNPSNQLKWACFLSFENVSVPVDSKWVLKESSHTENGMPNSPGSNKMGGSVKVTIMFANFRVSDVQYRHSD